MWACDFEFRADPGERPWPVCMVACELHTGREIRLWRSELLRLRTAPFGIGEGALFLAYFASAELGCFLELGWPLPTNVVDLFVEHRCETNGVPTTCGDGLVGALALRGLAHIDAGEKEAMRRLVMDRAAWSDAQQAAISGLLRLRHHGIDRSAPANGANDRLAACLAARPIHGGRCPDGAGRGADRPGDA